MVVHVANEKRVCNQATIKINKKRSANQIDNRTKRKQEDSKKRRFYSSLTTIPCRWRLSKSIPFILGSNSHSEESGNSQLQKQNFIFQLSTRSKKKNNTGLLIKPKLLHTSAKQKKKSFSLQEW